MKYKFIDATFDADTQHGLALRLVYDDGAQRRKAVRYDGTDEGRMNAKRELKDWAETILHG